MPYLVPVQCLLIFQVYRYYAGGTEGEETLRDNRAVWGRYKLLPTVMRNVSKVDCSTTLLGGLNHGLSAAAGRPYFL